MISLFLPVGFLLLVSLTVISSISLKLFFLQLTWVAIGSILILIFWFIDWRSFLNQPWVIWGFYLVTILLLVLVLWKAPLIRNTRSWLIFGPISFQPVELVKISLILLYAHYFSRRHLSIARWQNILTSFVYFVVPVSLIIFQPDFGSALVLFGIWFGFLLVSGLPRRRILLTFIIFAIASFFIWNWGLADYHRQRIIGVFYPERDVLNINYSVSQSKIAIASAGWLGQGYGQGSQTQLGFLPEPATDFIFAALIEEWGWLTGILVVIAFLALIFKILKIGLLANRNFVKFICLGTVMIFGLQFFLNTGSATGIFPVIGITFPFLSYGGSSLLTSFFLLSIINAIAVRS